MRAVRALAACGLLFAACAAPYDYGNYLAHMPRSILVLPAVNDSVEAGASNAFLATVTTPLAERGYYVFPIAVVETYFRENGRPTPADMHAVEPAKLREVFGADAALYVHIREWGTSYAVVTSSSSVAIECQLVDLASGTVLWTGGQRVVDSSGSGGGGLFGMLASAIVSQIVSSVSDPCPNLAYRANSVLFADQNHGLLLGPRHPGFAEDQEKRRAAATR